MIGKILNSLRKVVLREEHIEIEYNHLLDFLSEKKDTIIIEVGSKAKKELENVNTLINEANSKILVLSLKRADENLSEDIRDKVRESLVTYVGSSRNFLKNYTYLEDESKKLVENLENFNEIAKEYERNIKSAKVILSENFKIEFEECDKSILTLIEKLTELSSSLSLTRVKEIEKLEELSSMIVDIEDKKSELLEKKKKMEENLSKINELKEKNLSKIDEFKMSPEFSKFHEMISKKKIIMDKLAEHKELFEHDFLKLKPAIVYYQSKYFKNIFNKYFDDPYSAFLEDEGELFVQALPDLKEKVQSGVIPIDPEKKKLCVMTIEKLTKENFVTRMEDYKSLKEQKFRCERIISSSKIMNDYTETEYKLEHINVKLKDQKDALRGVVGELSGLDSTKFVSDAEKKVNQVFGKKNTVFKIISGKKDEPEED